jgi:anti-sigma factor RsiW
MSPEDPLDRLIADWLSDRISPDDFRTLDARLRTDPAARAALRRTASLDAALRDWATGQEISAAWAGADAQSPEGSSTRATPSPFRRSIRRALAHVGKEVLKLPPTWVESDSTATIVLVAAGIGIGTAYLHGEP